MRQEAWIKHDVQSRSDGKMVWFMGRTGCEGYGAFWGTVEVLKYQRDHTIPLTGPEFEGIAEQLMLTPERYREILDVAVLARLFESDGESLWQHRLLVDEAERSKTKQEAGRLGGVRSGEARRRRGGATNEAENLASTNPEQSQTDSEANEAEPLSNEATKLDRLDKIDEKRIDNNILSEPAGSRKQIRLDQVEFPPSLDTPEVRQFLFEWLEHKRVTRRPYKNAQSVNRLLKHWVQFGPVAFGDAVDLSIRQNYQGLIDPNLQKAGAKSSTGFSRSFESNVARREQFSDTEGGTDGN